ncbi:MAG: RecQ family ATP-dependent DNA helicase [Capnocytophaga sp.]|nr:RecQ family ATP-dependent DNA helicase [Capnocytophaga sp.]
MQQPTQILQTYWGYDTFRYPQGEIIRAVLDQRDVLALMPTGGGKSVCFQVPALAMEGICIVISPLVALIKDQVDTLKRKGIRALSIPGGTSFDDVQRILNNAVYGNYKFLYLSPERLQQEMVREYLRKMDINLIAIDEAHCLSHWGKDFRPSYLECIWLKQEFPKTPVLALTASATRRVQQDIMDIMQMTDTRIIRTSLERPNIACMVYDTEEKYQLLERILTNNKGTAILYMRSRQGTVRMSEYLTDRNISATYFHGGMPADEKNKKLSMWLMDEVQVMVATNAFGMGIDKPDVRTVVHWEIPPTLEDYFQEAGRAGRDGRKSFAVLLYNANDIRRAQRQFSENMPDVDFLKTLYTKLNSHFFVAIGEGIDARFSLDFTTFCQKYRLPQGRTLQGLEMLDRLGILSLAKNFSRKAIFRFVAHNRLLMEYVERNAPMKPFVYYLLRTYTGLFEQDIAVSIEKIADRIQENTLQIKHWFEKMAADDIITYRHQDTDLELTFLVMRDDERTINAVAKSVRLLSESKQALQQTVWHYITNENQCRSVQLLDYFGETGSKDCGICSVCVGKYPHPEAEDMRKQIVALLDKQSLTSHEIMQQLSYDENNVLKMIQQLLENQEITINIYNQYTKNV